MSGLTSLTAPFALPSETRTPVVALIIEQRPWPANTGILTNGGMVRHIIEALYGQIVPEDEDTGSSPVNCGLDNLGRIVSEVWVYPYTSGLWYQLQLSHGTLDLEEMKVEPVRQVEVLNFKPGSSTLQTKYPVRAIESVRWLGEQHDADLNPIEPPDLSVTGVMEITTSVPVYGAASVIYQTERHVYPIIIPPREDAPENLYSSVAYAVYTGGLVWEPMTPPPGAEEYQGYGENGCGYGSTSFPDDDDPPPAVPDNAQADREIIVDWCSQITISDNVYES